MLRVNSRVQFSRLGVRVMGHWSRMDMTRVGTVRSTSEQIVSVVWDGRKTPASYHEDFIRLASPRDDLQTALEAMLGPLD